MIGWVQKSDRGLAFGLIVAAYQTPAMTLDSEVENPVSIAHG